MIWCTSTTRDIPLTTSWSSEETSRQSNMPRVQLSRHQFHFKPTSGHLEPTSSQPQTDLKPTSRALNIISIARNSLTADFKGCFGISMPCFTCQDTRKFWNTTLPHLNWIGTGTCHVSICRARSQRISIDPNATVSIASDLNGLSSLLAFRSLEIA